VPFCIHAIVGHLQALCVSPHPQNGVGIAHGPSGNAQYPSGPWQLGVSIMHTSPGEQRTLSRKEFPQMRPRVDDAGAASVVVETVDREQALSAIRTRNSSDRIRGRGLDMLHDRA
jgi:hypothetical protein